MKPVSTDESRRFHRVLPIPVVALFGNSVDPLGEALMRLFPDGFATSRLRYQKLECCAAILHQRNHPFAVQPKQADCQLAQIVPVRPDG